MLLKDLLVIIDSTTQVAHFIAQQGAVIAGEGIVGFLFEHTRKVADGSIPVSRLGTQDTTVIQRKHLVGFQFESLVVIAHRTAQVVHVVPYHRTIVVERTLLGIKTNSMVHVVEGLLKSLVLRKDHTAHPIGIGITLVQLYHLVQVSQRPDAISQLDRKLCSIEISSGFVGEKLNEVIEAAVGSSIVLLQGVRNGQATQEYLVLWLDTQALFEVLDGAIILLEILASDATHLPCGHQEWVALNACRRVLGGSQVIVQINLRDASVEVRVSQIGLDGYHLVEVLYRQHIVLKVEGIASDSQHAVGIDLGCQRGDSHHQR